MDQQKCTGNDNPCCDEKISVLLTGFPENTKLENVENYLIQINNGRQYTIIKKNRSKFRGFVFIHYDSREEAENFISKELRFEGKLLDYKLTVNHNDYLQDCLRELTQPKKIFVKGIPKHYSKLDIECVFKKFGGIEEVVIIKKSSRKINSSFITFSEFQFAEDCVNNNLSENLDLAISYANPKFSSFMLYKTNDIIKDIIEEIRQGTRIYDPKDFGKILKEYEQAYQHFNLTKDNKNQTLSTNFDSKNVISQSKADIENKMKILKNQSQQRLDAKQQAHSYDLEQNNKIAYSQNDNNLYQQKLAHNIEKWQDLGNLLGPQNNNSVNYDNLQQKQYHDTGRNYNDNLYNCYEHDYSKQQQLPIENIKSRYEDYNYTDSQYLSDNYENYYDSQYQQDYYKSQYYSPENQYQNVEQNCYQANNKNSENYGNSYRPEFSNYGYKSTNVDIKQDQNDYNNYQINNNFQIPSNEESEKHSHCYQNYNHAPQDSDGMQLRNCNELNTGQKSIYNNYDVNYNYSTLEPDMYYIQQHDKIKNPTYEKLWQCSQEEKVNHFITNQKTDEKQNEYTNFHNSFDNDKKTSFQLENGRKIPQVTPENLTINVVNNNIDKQEV